MTQTAQYRRIKCPNCDDLRFKFVGIARQCWACDWLWDPGERGRETIGYREEKD